VPPSADTPSSPIPSEPLLTDLFAKHNGAAFLTPGDLARFETRPRRVAEIGSCLLESWQFHRQNPSGCPVDLIVMNNVGALPDNPSDGIQISDYDFQVVQIPMRSLLLDETLSRLPYDSIEAHEQALGEACDRLALQLRCRMTWNARHRLLTFVVNFFIPQRNPMGCLFPKYDLRNPEYFVGKINAHLERLVGEYKNAYILDVDRISASIGRRHCQDDSVEHFAHNALLGTPDRDTTRIEPMPAMSEHYDIKWPLIFRDALWSEMLAMYRTVRQADSVKLVVVDLDDTLWKGVSGDMAEISPVMVEGWPLGFMEALLYLKKRGILLAVISKNDEARIREIWPQIFRGRMNLEDFADIRINWNPKTENMQEILEAMNLLPRAVVFIDDNPMERASMQHAFPEMRILGRHPYYFRRTLLWAPETQVASITEESSHRTEMIQAQMGREAERKELSREEFLRKSAPQVSMLAIHSTDHPRFARAFELINKTNQFNTTGRRWTMQECAEFLRERGLLYAF
jgi:FkbH-like protein